MRTASRALVCALALAPVAAGWAQELTSAPPEPPRAQTERFEARLAGAGAHRAVFQRTASLGLDSEGWSAANVDLSAWGWLLADGRLGLFAAFAHDAFAVADGAGGHVSAGLWRLRVAPTVRVVLGPVRVEPMAGFALDELPDFGGASTLTFAPARRQGLLLAARALVPLGPLTVELQGEQVAPFFTGDGRGRPAVSGGHAVGGAVRLPLYRSGGVVLSGVADLTWSEDRFAGSGASMEQSQLRAGLGVAFAWHPPLGARGALEEPSVSPGRGLVHLVVLDASRQAPVSDLALELETSAGPLTAVTGQGGETFVGEVAPGVVVARPASERYVPTEATTEVFAGERAELVLLVAPAAAGTGGLELTVTDKATGAPVAAARVRAGAATARTTAKGKAVLFGLPPGPLALHVDADGFQPADEAATVVAGVRSPVELVLLPTKRRLPATLTGLVRDGASGRPVPAELVVRPGQRRVRADARGAFSLTLPAGSYTVTISAPGFVPQVKPFSVNDAEQAIFNVDLSPR